MTLILRKKYAKQKVFICNYLKNKKKIFWHALCNVLDRTNLLTIKEKVLDNHVEKERSLCQ